MKLKTYSFITDISSKNWEIIAILLHQQTRIKKQLDDIAILLIVAFESLSYLSVILVGLSQSCCNNKLLNVRIESDMSSSNSTHFTCQLASSEIVCIQGGHVSFVSFMGVDSASDVHTQGWPPSQPRAACMYKQWNIHFGFVPATGSDPYSSQMGIVHYGCRRMDGLLLVRALVWRIGAVIEKDKLWDFFPWRVYRF